MAPKAQIDVTFDEYQQKRFELVKDLVAAVCSKESLDLFNELKQRESIVYNCMLMADTILKEMGYRVVQDSTSIRSLQSILKTKEE